jgi:hypothetical protein
MPTYRIRIFDAGIWNGEMPYHCNAKDALEAAEIVFGSKLTKTGRLSELCAEVWEEHHPRQRTSFYAVAPEGVSTPADQPASIANDNRRGKRAATRPSPAGKDLR